MTQLAKAKLLPGLRKQACPHHQQQQWLRQEEEEEEEFLAQRLLVAVAVLGSSEILGRWLVSKVKDNPHHKRNSTSFLRGVPLAAKGKESQTHRTTQNYRSEDSSNRANAQEFKER